MERKRERDKEETWGPSDEMMDDSEEQDTQGREIHSLPSRETTRSQEKQKTPTPKKKK
jgi:hypothetical protein